MNSLREYFSTDWAAMTLHDWIGMIMTVSVFIIMLVAYVLIFHPKNRENLEAQRYILFDDDRLDPEEKK
ncbi:MAG TPA: cbb3-type cytochrome c oxidase subunit 3 [Gammaproteobacteria bacterium]|nr:cbb3-type cytochrome c oxidase subunit 3 [Gammaproteobacteria bacterium]